MLAVVTGASGLVGGNLAVELLRQGFKVRATRRGSTKVDHLEAHPIEWVDADLGSRDKLTEAFRGADAVFHCAANVDVRDAVTADLVKGNVEGTRNVLAATREARAGRLVYTSSVVAVGVSENGDPCNEDARWNFADHDLADGYAITKKWAEDIVVGEAAAGLDVVIVNPTYMFGPLDSRPSSGKLIVEVVRGKVPGTTTGYNNFVDVRDVARGMILALEKGKVGRRYILGGENLSYKSIMQSIAVVAGVKPPPIAVPKWAATVLGAVGDLQERSGIRPLVTSTAVRYAFTPRFIFTSARAEAELGYERSPVEQGIADAITWFRQRGMLPSR